MAARDPGSGMYLRSKRLEGRVHGIPTRVSPKESRHTKGIYYFEAQLYDGKRSTWVVSFDTAHLAAMKKAADEKTVVTVKNCIVKPNTVTRTHRDTLLHCHPI